MTASRFLERWDSSRMMMRIRSSPTLVSPARERRRSRRWQEAAPPGRGGLKTDLERGNSGPRGAGAHHHARAVPPFQEPTGSHSSDGAASYCIQPGHDRFRAIGSVSTCSALGLGMTCWWGQTWTGAFAASSRSRATYNASSKRTRPSFRCVVPTSPLPQKQRRRWGPPAGENHECTETRCTGACGR